LDLAVEYKKNPPKDDFMADVMELLGETDDNFLLDGKKKDDDDEEF